MPVSYTIGSHIFEAPTLSAGLYVVATPIGNLRDITLRALETLAGCDVIACEDTRSSGVLLSRYGIDKPKVSYNEHNADTRGPDLLRQISEGRSVCLISDAGTPLISDPGQRLVQEAVDAGLAVVPLPGASAPLAAMMAAGIETDGFLFAGFSPTKAKARLDWLYRYGQAQQTVAFFESPQRLVASLSAMAETFGPTRQAVIARELTKLHETFHRGSLIELLEEFSTLERVRGELVILLPPDKTEQTQDIDPEPLLREALVTMRTKDAVNSVAALTGLPKQALYAKALKLQNDG
ncbi:MAG: 16S rRNA (cytidine(1402)-2'-O)-methyltransferase [Pseudomonadota bacterium]